MPRSMNRMHIRLLGTLLARYRCAQYGKTCNALTGTPLAHLRKRERWMAYTQALTQSLSVRKAAKQCGIDKNTAFLW